MRNDAKKAAVLLVVVVVALLGYKALTTREDRTVGQKIDAAAEKLDSGVDNAARELQDRTPAERAEDEVRDATDSPPRQP